MCCLGDWVLVLKNIIDNKIRVQRIQSMIEEHTIYSTENTQQAQTVFENWRPSLNL